ncbi:MAG: SDR family NAD(P)-dependent oxidoreductase [Anaerolineae bacterium]|nr:SDR family NAD(P)-dependent oxidoreductase [Anaerolineae bacterium]
MSESSQARVILITGASSGLGREMALQFARRGERVIAAARRMDRLEALVTEANGFSGEIVPVEVDVLDPASVASAVDLAMMRWGRIDVVIPNAGLGQRGSIADSAWEDLEIVLRTNIEGALHTIRAAVPAMRQSKGGHIVLISSVLSLATGPYCAIYSASKTAINAIARGLRAELRDDNIWVTNVILGQTHTEFAQSRRGQAGKVAGKLPTMTAEFAAARIVQATRQRRRSIVLRPVDHLIDWMGMFVPWFSDRLLARVYRPKSGSQAKPIL